MKIVCIPGLDEEEVEQWTKKLNNAQEKEIIVIPYECSIIEQ